MIWHEHTHIGVHESGNYTVRRCTRELQVWIKRDKEFRFLGGADTVKQAKEIAEIHAKEHP